MPTKPENRPVIAVFVKGLGIGGAEKLIAEGARHWNRTEFDYRVAYVLPWKNQLVDDLEDLGVQVECVGGNTGSLLRAAVNLSGLLREWEVDLVHSHLPAAGILARLTTHAPVVYTEHNLSWTYRWPTRLANRLTYRRNRAVTAVSEAVAASVSDYHGPAVEVVPNGVSTSDDPEAADRARKELGLAADHPLVVHVGNIRPGKGHDLLVDATAELVRLRPDVSVVSIGGEKRPGDLIRLRRRTSELGLDGRLRFLGRRADALSFIAAADVYVNPADFEGMPVTILEAMAAARPVVATAVGGVPSVIEDGWTGHLVDSGSAGELAKTIAETLADPVEAEAIGQRAAQVIAADHGLEPMVRAFENVYRRILP